MDYQLYGFLISKDVHLDIDNRRLYRLSSIGTDKNIIFGSTIFNETMMQLFLYLLNNARDKRVTKEELLKKIWEENNLSPSSQRLWQVLNGLNSKLTMLGLPEDFILNVKGKGYMVNCKDIVPLYYKTSDTHLVS